MIDKSLFTRLLKDPNFIAFVFFALISLISLSFFDKGTTLGSGDNYRAIDYRRYLSTVDSTWNGDRNGGLPELNLQNHTPYSLFFIPLSFLGFSPQLSQRLWIYISFLLPGYLMFVFLGEFFNSKKVIPWEIKFVTSLFYVFNQVTIIQPYGIVSTKYPVYLCLPLIPYLILKIFNAQTWSKRISWAVILSLSSILLAPVSRNIAELAPLIMVSLIIFIYEFVKCKKKVSYLLLFLITLILGVLVNFWWIISSFYTLFLYKGEMASILKDSFGRNGPVMFEALRLMGFWALSQKSHGVPYFSYGLDYYTKGGVVLTYIITALVFIPLFFLAKKVFLIKKAKIDINSVYIAYIITFVGIFLLKGANPPYGDIFKNLRENVPILVMFREPYSKFILLPLFGYTLLINVSLYLLTLLLKKIHKDVKYVVIISFILITFNISYPIISGNIINRTTFGPEKQALAKVPKYWIDLYDYSKINNNDGRVLTLPKNEYYRKSYIWESGHIGYPYELYYKGNTTVYYKGDFDYFGSAIFNQPYETIEQYISSKDDKYIRRFINLCKMLSITRILQMNDFDWNNYPDYETWSVNNMEEFYSDIEPFTENKVTFGEFSKEYLENIPHISGGDNIFRLENHAKKQDYYDSLLNKPSLEIIDFDTSILSNKKVYSPQVIISSDSIPDLLIKLEDASLYDVDFVVLDSSINTEQIPLSNYSFNYEKLKDTRYKVSLDDQLTKDITLVFNEMFNKDWTLMKNCNWLRCKNEVSTDHYKSNYFSNMWVVDSDELNNTEYLYIYHKSEFRLKIGLIISGVSVLLCMGLLIYSKKLSISADSHEKATD